jgi:hypothetical protein
MFGGFMQLDKKQINHKTLPAGQFDNVMIAVIWDMMSSVWYAGSHILNKHTASVCTTQKTVMFIYITFRTSDLM